MPIPGGLVLGALEVLEGRAGGVGGTCSRLLDRLIRGRAWIGLVAFALIGIVAMQLWVVKLGVGIGRALEHTEFLQRENSTLAIEDSTLSSGERVERLALAKGMVLAPPGALHFDTLRGPLDARLAVAALAKPTQTQTAGLAGTGASSTTTTGAEAGATTPSSTEAAPSTGTGAEAGASTETGASTGTGTNTAAGGEATSAGATTQTPAAEGSAGAPSATAGAAGASTGSSAAGEGASTGPSAATGGSSEAASPPTGSGGGTQAPPEG